MRGILLCAYIYMQLIWSKQSIYHNSKERGRGD